LKRLRCHEITVSGRTITKADFQSCQIIRRPIPKYSVSICQFWSLNATFEDGQLLTQGGILQGDLFLAAENENNETD